MYQVIKVDGGYISVKGVVQYFNTQYAAELHAKKHNERIMEERMKEKKDE